MQPLKSILHTDIRKGNIITLFHKGYIYSLEQLLC